MLDKFEVPERLAKTMKRIIISVLDGGLITSAVIIGKVPIAAFPSNLKRILVTKLKPK